jgi:hypothetical protein
MSTDSMNVPNLDAMTPEELRDLCDDLQRLALYAMNKATAMQRRAAGKINDAIRAEAICEQIYQSLPDEWRW